MSECDNLLQSYDDSMLLMEDKFEAGDKVSIDEFLTADDHIRIAECYRSLRNQVVDFNG